ncbi:S-methyl-5-thioribose-1-phosphate isomerase [Synechococcus sp. PCC 7502]|uniref:S-methyl-5-thioribose-1-phosphate isomerase n=1 Tax=Synechococcus sp. PCC 7502 TaxID=1173263 RepID=UPI00029FD816|nr:S-methyl-5-thioribose-1-phosphate isomerase [Synechococcus sp. PCC 7502]AFY73098.1 S-methyl-5-thioribose-1-phosphate isomerase [Synechococcus sp. PCC 7502]
MVNGIYKPFWLDGESLIIIDQTKLPFSYETLRLTTPDDAIAAIKNMNVRGAGVIGNVGAFGVYLAAIASVGNLDAIIAIAQQIRIARPTAVNLTWAVDRVIKVLKNLGSENPEIIINTAKQEAINISDEDVENSEKIGKFGCDRIQEISNAKSGQTVNILTHCNAGWLAIVDSGSALAPIYEAHSRGIDIHVWVDETRPRNQGASLTAWELQQAGIKHTIIADNTGGLLMQYGLVDMCIVGADRVTAQGDVINKIGTYLKALAAKDHNIPFYVALPSSTFDFELIDGIKEVEIETRNPDEVLYIQGITADQVLSTVRIAPYESNAINYAFDITPNRLVTGLITEQGICAANQEAIAHQKKELSR